MVSKTKSVLIWLFAFLFTAALAIYQRMTGPTYPVRGKVAIAGQTIKYRLIRTYESGNGARVSILASDTSVRGEIRYRRFLSYDNWITASMVRSGDTLTGILPDLPPAGKVMYHVTLIHEGSFYQLNEQPAILRYKGHVPEYVLLPHILIIFLAMVFSTLTGLMALSGSKNTYIYAWITFITLTVGGMILGPVVQKFSFGAFWTGWPFGHDLTDNKSLVAFIFWGIAVMVLHRNRKNKLWPLIAAIILLAVFLIPHSVLGSEIDFTKEQRIENTR